MISDLRTRKIGAGRELRNLRTNMSWMSWYVLQLQIAETKSWTEELVAWWVCISETSQVKYAWPHVNLHKGIIHNMEKSMVYLEVARDTTIPGDSTTKWQRDHSQGFVEWWKTAKMVSAKIKWITLISWQQPAALDLWLIRESDQSAPSLPGE